MIDDDEPPGFRLRQSFSSNRRLPFWYRKQRRTSVRRKLFAVFMAVVYLGLLYLTLVSCWYVVTGIR